MKFNTKLTVCYSQIYIEDLSAEYLFQDDLWNEEELRAMLVSRENLIIIGTVRSIDASIFLEVLTNKPELDLKDWDHINQCSIKLNSGLRVMGDLDDEDMLKINLNPGIYEVYVCYKGLDSISPDGLDGDDVYYIFLWPSEEHIPNRVLKQWVSCRMN